MPVVGERPKKSMAEGYANHPMHAYAEAFTMTAQNILSEAAGADIYKDARDVINSPLGNQTLKAFFMENSCDAEHMTPDEINDHMAMMEAQYENDREAILENVGIAEMNPVVGMVFPMHKNILMNMVFDKGAIQKVVAQAPKFTVTMETRILVDTEGNEIDMYLEQDKMTAAIDKTAALTDFDVTLPLTTDTEIVHDKLGGLAGADDLSIETMICAVKVPNVYYEVGDILPDEDTGYVEMGGEVAEEAGTHDTWYRVVMPFVPGYQGFERTLMQPVTIKYKTLNVDTVEVATFKDVISGSMENNRLNIQSLHGNVTEVRVRSRLDTSNARATTCSVRWKAKTDIVEIPSAIPINTTISPEEVKDISALYNVNQLTKIMSLYKTVLGNYKDDKIKQHLDESYVRLNKENKNYSTFDWAPRAGYAGDHIQWRRDTFMEHIDNHVQKLLQVLNDPNMTVTIFGQPNIIRRITPVNYSFQTPSQIGPVELDYSRTVVTSDRRVYNFIGSDKMRNSDELIVILCPHGSQRIIYRIYDYQMYVSNEIRNANNPALPAIHAFERWKFMEYQPVQGRIRILHQDGLTDDYSAFPVTIKNEVKMVQE